MSLQGKQETDKARAIRVAGWCLNHGKQALREGRLLDAEIFKAAMNEIERLARLVRGAGQ